ncbi:uncharacterized protein LOC129600132 isoform X2 [Paramacrobiotus metropolitanus]|nr:uncharacterized protein LOC129600132 isoform X2 [Paramacrobiotus metropolitanus]
MEELPYQYAPMRSCNRCSHNTNNRKCVECTQGPNYRSDDPQVVVSRLYDEVLMRSLDAYRTVTLPEYWTIVCATPLYYNGIYKSAVKFIGDHADEWSCATHPENFGRSTANLMQRITAPPNQNYPTNVGGQQTPSQQPAYGQWQPPVMFQQQSLPFSGFQQQQQPIRYTNMALQVPPGTLPPEHIAHLQQSLPSGSYQYDLETRMITPCPWPAGTAPKESQQRQTNPLLANLPPLTRNTPASQTPYPQQTLQVQPSTSRAKKAANWNVRATRDKPVQYKPDASVLLMPERQTHPQRIRRDIDVIRRDLDQYIDRVASVIGTVNADQRTEIGKAITDTLDLLHTVGYDLRIRNSINMYQIDLFRQMEVWRYETPQRNGLRSALDISQLKKKLIEISVVDWELISQFKILFTENPEEFLLQFILPDTDPAKF